MNIVVAGGTGFIGKALCEQLLRSRHRLTILTRTPAAVERLFGPAVKAVQWDARNSGGWEHSLNGVQAVINLAGAGIADARWTDSRKQLLTESRIYATRLLVQACARSRMRPEVFVSASGIGFYGPHGDEALDESSASGQGFLSGLCVQWESTAAEAAAHDIRVIRLRTGMVLERDGGALPRMALPFRMFLGGPVMPGTQWVSWIHRDDIVGLIEWVLTTSTVSGPLNAVAPSPVTMGEFCRALGLALHRPSWLAIPKLALEVALGELGSMMTTGQRVVPAVAERNGYTFKFPEVHGAVRTIFSGGGEDRAQSVSREYT